MEWPGCGIEAAATAMVGVVEATAGIAAAGTIVVDSDRTGRLVSLLPRVGVFVLREADIVPLTGDVLRATRRWPDGPPTNVVLVTGPSRSGDIEMRLVVGVRPRRSPPSSSKADRRRSPSHPVRTIRAVVRVGLGALRARCRGRCAQISQT